MQTYEEISRIGHSLKLVIADIRDLTEGFDHHFSTISKALAFEPTVDVQIDDWMQQQVKLALATRQKKVAFSIIRNATTLLTSLEEYLFTVRESLKWSLNLSGFTSWLTRRLGELDASEIIAIPRPHHAVEFALDDVGLLASSLHGLVENGIMSIPPQQLATIRKIRLFSVPRHDGLDARWHPVTLAHELGHLRYSDSFITDWLSRQKITGRSESGKTAIRIAKALKAGTKVGPDWYATLVNWLVETACDSVLLFYYGMEGVNALESLLSITGEPHDTDTHPESQLRIKILRTAAAVEIKSERVKDLDADAGYVQAQHAYCEFAHWVKRDILADLASRFSVDFRLLSDRVRRDALIAIGSTLSAQSHSPHSQLWEQEHVAHNPSVIESGLVRSLWARPVPSRPPAAFDDRREMVYRSLDSLEFCHRFELARLKLSMGEIDLSTIVRQDHPLIEDLKMDERIPNALWVTRKGVFDDVPRRRNQRLGKHAWDMRLGRYFITFVRSRIGTLNALDLNQATKRMQEMVEVDWGDFFVLHPGEMVLGVTLESVEMDSDCVAQVLSRSSVGRFGLLSATAVHVQPGFRGCLTLELVNLASVPLQLTPGQRVAQIVPGISVGKPMKYEGHYSRSADWKPRFSRAYRDWDSLPLGIIRQGLDSGRN